MYDDKGRHSASNLSAASVYISPFGPHAEPSGETVQFLVLAEGLLFDIIGKVQYSYTCGIDAVPDDLMHLMQFVD